MTESENHSENTPPAHREATPDATLGGVSSKTTTMAFGSYDGDNEPLFEYNDDRQTEIEEEMLVPETEDAECLPMYDGEEVTEEFDVQAALDKL